MTAAGPALGRDDPVRALRRWVRPRSRSATARRMLLATPAAGRVAPVAGRAVLHCFGDSHARVFEHVRRRRLLPRTWLATVSVRSATAYGVANAASASGARRSFDGLLDRLPPGRDAVFMLGEVDCAHLIWALAHRRGADPFDHLEEALERYESFLTERAGHLGLILATAPLPTVEDLMAGIDPARREIDASLEQRTQATMRFNAGLRAMADQHRWRLLDTEAHALEPRSQTVRAELVVAHDHHYEWSRHAELVAGGLRCLGFE